jgi:hypothetical protein
MNATQSLIAAIALTAAAAGSAFAQEATVEAPFVSGSASRSAVAAQARDAVRQGNLHELYAINPVQAKTGGLSREAVRAETLAALASGEIARLNATVYDSVAVHAQPLRMSALGR